MEGLSGDNQSFTTFAKKKKKGRKIAGICVFPVMIPAQAPPLTNNRVPLCSHFFTPPPCYSLCYEQQRVRLSLLELSVTHGTFCPSLCLLTRPHQDSAV